MPFQLFNSGDPREYAFFESPEAWIGQEGILVTQRKSLEEIRRDYDPYCSSIDTLGNVPISRSGKVEWNLRLYRCVSLTRPYPTLFR